jgi:hypothetical protein
MPQGDLGQELRINRRSRESLGWESVQAGLDEPFLTESLILAQNERWRRG